MNSQDINRQYQLAQLKEERERDKKWAGMSLSELEKEQKAHPSHAINHVISQRRKA